MKKILFTLLVQMLFCTSIMAQSIDYMEPYASSVAFAQEYQMEMLLFVLYAYKQMGIIIFGFNMNVIIQTMFMAYV